MSSLVAFLLVSSICLFACAQAGVPLDQAPLTDAPQAPALRGHMVASFSPQTFSAKKTNPFAVDFNTYEQPSHVDGLDESHPAFQVLREFREYIESQGLTDDKFSPLNTKTSVSSVPMFGGIWDWFKGCPDCKKSTPELITQLGYPVEIHEVETADGYILEMHRIPHGRNGDDKNKKKQPCVVQHGLLDSSSTWVMQSAEDSLPLRLADLGYDVWLGNSRGNTYSVKHKKYTRKDSDYWKFSWDEMALYDIPAVLDYVTKVSGFEKVNYVGHSQGTTQIFAALSEPDNKISDKFNVFTALAPVTYMAHQSSLLLNFIVKLKLAEVFNFFGLNEFLPSSALTKLTAELVCKNAQFVCKGVIFALCGMHHGDPAQNVDPARLPVMVAHTPAGTSVQNMLHWAQLIETGEFQAFDYGEKRNMQVYGTPTPKKYDLSNISVPMEWYAGTYDDLADPADVLHALSTAKREYVERFVNMETYNHMDMVWGRDLKNKDNMYDKVIEGFMKHGPPTPNK